MGILLARSRLIHSNRLMITVQFEEEGAEGCAVRSGKGLVIRGYFPTISYDGAIHAELRNKVLSIKGLLIMAVVVQQQ